MVRGILQFIEQTGKGKEGTNNNSAQMTGLNRDFLSLELWVTLAADPDNSLMHDQAWCLLLF